MTDVQAPEASPKVSPKKPGRAPRKPKVAPRDTELPKEAAKALDDALMENADTPSDAIEELRTHAEDPAGSYVTGFPPEMYRDCGSFYELIFGQRTKEWLAARKSRVTASVFAQAADISPYKSRRQLLLEMSGLSPPADPSFFARRAMAHGTAFEPLVRNMYAMMYKREVVERGLVIPKWCTRMGVSVDGHCARTNSIIEIKCPVSMYPELVDHSHRRKAGEVFDKYYHEHIKPDHYAQMQGGMAILDAEECDYIVFCSNTQDMCVTRIYRNREYWDTFLYPRLLSFVSELDKATTKAKRLAEQTAHAMAVKSLAEVKGKFVSNGAPVPDDIVTQAESAGAAVEQ